MTAESFIRWLFALQMLFWGLNGFFLWVKIPSTPERIDRFVAACIETGFIMPVTKALEVVLSVCLLANFLVPLSLFLFAPLMFVITGLHVFLNPRPFAVLLSCSLPYGILLWIHAPNIYKISVF